MAATMTNQKAGGYVSAYVYVCVYIRTDTAALTPLVVPRRMYAHIQGVPDPAEGISM